MLKKILNNSLANTSLQFLNIAVVFVMTPIIVKCLGKHDYGIWEIVTSIIGYMGLLQFGIPPAVVRYVAKYKALKDRDKLNEIYCSCFVIIFITGVLCSLLLAVWALTFPNVLVENKPSGQKYTIFLLILSINALVMFPSIFIESFHEGFQRYKLTRLVTAVKLIISNLVVYILFQKGYGLIAFAMVHTIALFIKFITLWILLSLPAFGKFRFKKKFISKEMLRELYIFGSKSFALGIAGRITFQTDSIVIGMFLGPAIVVYYVIPVNLLNKLKTIVMSITLVFMPHFSEMYSKSGSDGFVAEFLLYSRYLVGIFLCFFLGVFFLGLPFIKIWIGPEYADQGAYILYMIGFAFLLFFLNPLQGRILTSMGMHGVLAKVRMIEAVLNLTLSIILVNIYGKEGVALGTLLPALLIEPFILAAVSNRLGITSAHYIKSVLLPQCVPVIIVTALYFYIKSWIIPDSYFNIIQIGIVVSFVYMIFFWLFVVSKKERYTMYKRLGISNI